jgi:hypothetical protein
MKDTTNAPDPSPPEVEHLGRSDAETIETYLRLRSFADDWNAPGMEAYDTAERR